MSNVIVQSIVSKARLAELEALSRILKVYKTENAKLYKIVRGLLSQDIAVGKPKDFVELKDNLERLTTENTKLKKELVSKEEVIEKLRADSDSGDLNSDEECSKLRTEYKEILIEIVKLLHKGDYLEMEYILRDQLTRLNYFYS
ncbi:hypothetical protein [Snodgrassella sp. ESL0324]|uniref:hypothetical protein n=1 Tax=Snodgrassella sp. ESL0324 TaxID=2705033 RepID=UPI0015831D2B|nr:hypothetical protein [Snodgrassella sp. ESL0324]NUF08943.1 hypothetical protein [Snodgrassella sp. ESL0324]